MTAVYHGHKVSNQTNTAGTAIAKRCVIFSPGNENLNLCQFNDEEDDCRYFFTYEYGANNEVQVKVQQTKGMLILYLQMSCAARIPVFGVF